MSFQVNIYDNDDRLYAFNPSKDVVELVMNILDHPADAQRLINAGSFYTTHHDIRDQQDLLDDPGHECSDCYSTDFDEKEELCSTAKKVVCFDPEDLPPPTDEDPDGKA